MQVLKCDYLGNSLVAQQLKDPALSLLRLKLLLWHGFDLWYHEFLSLLGWCFGFGILDFGFDQVTSFG